MQALRRLRRLMFPPDPWLSASSCEPEDYAPRLEPALPPARRYVPLLVAAVAALLLFTWLAHLVAGLR